MTKQDDVTFAAEAFADDEDSSDHIISTAPPCRYDSYVDPERSVDFQENIFKRFVVTFLRDDISFSAIEDWMSSSDMAEYSLTSHHQQKQKPTNRQRVVRKRPEPCSMIGHKSVLCPSSKQILIPTCPIQTDDDLETMKQAIDEFRRIHRDLKLDRDRLTRWEAGLTQRESALRDLDTELERRVEARVQSQKREIHEAHIATVRQLEEKLDQSLREFSRLKTSFETLRLSNEDMRQRESNLICQRDRLERSLNGLQGRLLALQRRASSNNGCGVDRAVQASTTTSRNRDILSGTTKGTGATGTSASALKLASILLSWTNEKYLRHHGATLREDGGEGVDLVLQVLPPVLDVFRSLYSNGEGDREYKGGEAEMRVHCIRFLLWALVILDLAEVPLRSSLLSSMSRLGEDIFQDGKWNAIVKGDNENNIGELEVKEEDRLALGLVILRTVTQVDISARVLPLIPALLSSSSSLPLLPLLHPESPALMYLQLDCLLTLAAEKEGLHSLTQLLNSKPQFLARLPSLLLLSITDKASSLPDKVAVLLHKVAKSPHQRSLMEKSGVITASLEIIHRGGNKGSREETNFLIMNLRSMLQNIGISLD